MDDEPEKLKQEYISSINNLINECNDIDLLDFIMQLLQKNK